MNPDLIYLDKPRCACSFCGDASPSFSESGEYLLRCHKGTVWNPLTGAIHRHGDCSPTDLTHMPPKKESE